jgi:MoaE-MoaD fusion protein
VTAVPEVAIDVLLFGPLADLAASPKVRCFVPEGARVEDLLARLRERHPALGPRLASAAVAVNLAYVARDHALAPGDEVALIPPVSGG